MDEVKTWLSNPRHYKVGVMLYLKYGANPVFKKAITTEQESAYKKQRIIKELSQIANPGTFPPEANSTIAPPTETKAPSTLTPIDNSAAPAAIDPLPNHSTRQWPKSACKDDYEISLWEKATLLLKEIAALHAMLTTANSDYERRLYAFELLRKDDDLDNIYNTRDLYKLQNIKGQTSTEPEHITDPFLKAKRIENLKKYIRRTKSDILKLGDTEGRRQKLEDYLKEFNHYAEKIKIPKRNA